MKTLLAIINEPKESKDFIEYVADLASALKTNVHLLYTQNPVSYSFGTSDTTGAVAAQIQKDMEAQVVVAKSILSEHIKDVRSKVSNDVFIDYSSELGVSSHIIRKYISDNKADMVVLEGLKNESFWTHSPDNMEVIENVDCPVLIIPHSWHYKPFTEIVYATDYREEDVAGLKRLVALTQHSSPMINVLHITDSVDFEEKVKKAGFLDILQDQVAYSQINVKALSDNTDSDITELLNGYTEFVKADLIVLTKENRSFFERIFQSDRSTKIIQKAKLPVLVFNAKNKHK